MLHHHNCVSAVGKRRSGHDFDCFSGAHRAAEHLTRANFADHPQVAGNVRGANGKPVASRTRKRRIIAISDDRFGEHSTRCFQRGKLLGGRTGPCGAHFAQDAGPCLFEAQGHFITPLFRN
jgi:hypothetical protein